MFADTPFHGYKIPVFLRNLRRKIRKKEPIVKPKHDIFQSAATLNQYILFRYYLRLLFTFVQNELSSNTFLESLKKTFCKEII